MENLKNQICLTCGAQLVKISETQYVCPCCGNKYDIEKQSGPHVPVEAILTANTMRISLNFFQAEIQYKGIIQSYPKTDLSDVYWGLFLCEQRCMFESEENDGNRLPSFYDIVDSDIAASENLRNAISSAQKFGETDKADTYIALAKKMEESKKKYRIIKNTSNPYDIFICFKKSKLDSSDYTDDLKLARSIYNQLCKTYNVFFSEESLNTIVVRDYEPNIYHALYTAKVMLVICSDIRYINAKWVKNEWSRFLQMSRNTSDPKTIIPIFNGNFTAENLPEELRRFQGLKTDINLTSSLLSTIQNIIHPKDNETDFDARFKDLEDKVKNSLYRQPTESIDQKAYAKTLSKLANELFNNQQYSEAKKNYAEACRKDMSDYYSQYMLSVCDVNMGYISDTKILSLIRSTAQYAQSFVEDKSGKANFGIDFVINNFKVVIGSYIENIKSNMEKDVWFSDTNSISYYSSSEYDKDIRYYKKKGQESYDEYYQPIFKILTESINLFDKLCPLATKVSANKISFEKINTILETTNSILLASQKSFSLHIVCSDLNRAENKDYHITFGGENDDTKNLKSKLKLISTYISGMMLYENKKYIKAYHTLKTINIYNSKEITDECNKCTMSTRYNQAVKLYREKKYKEARAEFIDIGDYLKSKELVAELEPLILNEKYAEAVRQYDANDFDKAKKSFIELTEKKYYGIALPANGYKDSKNMIIKCDQLIKHENEKKKRPLTIAYCSIFSVLATILIAFGSMPELLYMQIPMTAALSITVVGGLALIGLLIFSCRNLKFKMVPVFASAVFLIFGLIWFTASPTALGFNITNVDQFQTLLINYGSAEARLVNDIDCEGRNIRFSYNSFDLDGNGHTISNINLYIVDSRDYFISDFSGSIRNVTFKDITVDYEYPADKYDLGFLIYESRDAEFENLKFYNINIKENVFTSDYDEMPYNVIVKYIRQNTHLSNIYIDQATCNGLQLYFEQRPY